MTTITIKNAEDLTQTEFESLDELRDYLYSEDLIRKEFSDEYQEEITQRSKQLKSGEVKGISLDEIQQGMASRIGK